MVLFPLAIINNDNHRVLGIYVKHLTFIPKDRGTYVWFEAVFRFYCTPCLTVDTLGLVLRVLITAEARG